MLIGDKKQLKNSLKKIFVFLIFQIIKRERHPLRVRNFANMQISLLAKKLITLLGLA